MLGDRTATGAHLVLDYQPSQQHGWPPGPGQALGLTIGGHVAAREFTHGGRSYRISLLSFGQPGDAPDPVFEDEPGDPDVAFRETLVRTFGVHHEFRYVGLRGDRALAVRSYSVFAEQENEMAPLIYGADLYVVYEPDPVSSRSSLPGTLRWIQVVKRSGAGRPAGSYVDPVGGTHPFAPTGGRTSIYGERIVNFAHIDGTFLFPARPGDETGALADTFIAEAFLVRDMRLRDAHGRDVVEVLGGIKHGWSVQERQP